MRGFASPEMEDFTGIIERPKDFTCFPVNDESIDCEPRRYDFGLGRRRVEG